MTTSKTRDYPYIRAWGKMMRSRGYYIAGQVDKARRERAPETATYYDDYKRRWNTFDQIPGNSETRRTIENIIAGMK